MNQREIFPNLANDAIQQQHVDPALFRSMPHPLL